MKKIINNFFKLLISGILAATVLSLFCFFYDYDGMGIENETGATKTRYIPHQLIGNMKEGFSFNQADKNGFINLSDASDLKPYILMMGSSHMEAKQIPTAFTMGALLNKKFPTYSIGASNHELDRCISNLQRAIGEYKPQKFVVLETDGCYIAPERMRTALLEKKNHFRIVE